MRKKQDGLRGSLGHSTTYFGPGDTSPWVSCWGWLWAGRYVTLALTGDRKQLLPLASLENPVQPRCRKAGFISETTKKGLLKERLSNSQTSWLWRELELGFHPEAAAAQQHGGIEDAGSERGGWVEAGCEPATRQTPEAKGRLWTYHLTA